MNTNGKISDYGSDIGNVKRNWKIVLPNSSGNDIVLSK